MIELPSRGERSDNRAQLLLVGAVATAIIILTIATLVNTTIYTGSIAPQAPDIAGQQAVKYERILDRDLQRLSNAVDDNSTAPGADQTDLRDNVTSYSHRLSVIAAQEGPVAVNVTFNETISDGPTQVADPSPGQIEGEDSGFDFDVIDSNNASDVSNLYIELDADTAASEPQPISLVVENNSTPDQQWRLDFYKVPSDNAFRVREANETGPTTVYQTCDFQLGGPRVTVTQDNVTNGTKTCNIDFAKNVDPPYVVSFEKGNKARDAKWSLTTPGDVNGPEFNPEESGNDPYINKLVTHAAFNVVYQTPSIAYKRTVELEVGAPVAPESGHVFLYSDFEESGLGSTAWTGSDIDASEPDDYGAGNFDISSGIAHTGDGAAFHNGDPSLIPGSGYTNGTIETAGSYDTSSYDAVVVEFWAQEGEPGGPGNPGGSDAGPETGEGEDLTVQYYNGTDWVTVGELVPPASPVSDPKQYYRRIRLDDPGALHSGFRFRFVMPADANSDRWFVDDIVLRGYYDR